MDVVLVGRAFIVRHDRILFVQRNFNNRNNPGLWEAPGGKVDQGELPLESLVREIGEEVGLTIRLISPVLAGEAYYITDEGNYVGMMYLPLYAAFEAEGDVSLSTEHCAMQWLTWEEANDRKDLTPATSHMLVIMEPWLHRS